jgi:hypothetical protein
MTLFCIGLVTGVVLGIGGFCFWCAATLEKHDQ